MKTTEQQHNARKRELMEKCFECYAENGLTGTGIKALADACGSNRPQGCRPVCERGALLDSQKAREKISPDVSGLYASEVY